MLNLGNGVKVCHKYLVLWKHGSTYSISVLVCASYCLNIYNWNLVYSQMPLKGTLSFLKSHQN